MLAGLHLPMLSLPPAATASAFVGAMGALFLLGGPKAADKMNQGLTSVLMALFFGILGAGALQSDAGATLTQGGADWAALGPALPIVFLSLVYHDLVPVLVQFLAGDRKTVRWVLGTQGAVYDTKAARGSWQVAGDSCRVLGVCRCPWRQQLHWASVAVCCAAQAVSAVGWMSGRHCVGQQCLAEDVRHAQAP